jgi:hypothetical protein
VSDHDPIPLEKLRGLAGLWQFLIVRSSIRARLEIERERNRAYADHRDRLPRGAELVDYEDGQGRGLWIRLQGLRPGYLGLSSCVPAVIELGPAAITEPSRPEDTESGR